MWFDNVSESNISELLLLLLLFLNSLKFPIITITEQNVETKWNTIKNFTPEKQIILFRFPEF